MNAEQLDILSLVTKRGLELKASIDACDEAIDKLDNFHEEASKGKKIKMVVKYQKRLSATWREIPMPNVDFAIPLSALRSQRDALITELDALTPDTDLRVKVDDDEDGEKPWRDGRDDEEEE